MLKKKKIAAVIKKDATARETLSDGHGRYCVIGGLLKFGGFPMEHMRSWKQGDDYWSLTDEARNFLMNKYGINSKVANLLLMENDNHKRTPERRKGLLKLLKEL